MKKIVTLLFFSALIFTGCKQDTVDGSSLKAFQSSTNSIASQLSTLKQVKFNEALYIIKNFGVEGENDTEELTAMAKLLQGKKADEIFALADSIAEKEGLEWRSTAPPSLGNMKIFDDELTLDEKDPSDVKAHSILINTKIASRDSLVGTKSIQIIPVLADENGKPILFEGAALATTMNIFSNGQKLYTAKNIIQDNHFRGFTLSFSALPEDKIFDNKIDISIEVYTKDKKLTMTKIGEPVNMNALKPIITEAIDELPTTIEDATDVSSNAEKPKAQPKTSVQRFLNNVSNQNLRAAYEASNNPTWGSYEKFSNPNSGFGNVKSIHIQSISEKSISGDNATVKASYEVVDKNDNTVTVNASFGLKYSNGEWKIVSYSL